MKEIIKDEILEVNSLVSKIQTFLKEENQKDFCTNYYC